VILERQLEHSTMQLRTIKYGARSHRILKHLESGDFHTVQYTTVLWFRVSTTHLRLVVQPHGQEAIELCEALISGDCHTVHNCTHSTLL